LISVYRLVLKVFVVLWFNMYIVYPHWTYQGGHATLLDEIIKKELNTNGKIQTIQKRFILNVCNVLLFCIFWDVLSVVYMPLCHGAFKLDIVNNISALSISSIYDITGVFMWNVYTYVSHCVNKVMFLLSNYYHKKHVSWTT